jgi:hypothetical protein
VNLGVEHLDLIGAVAPVLGVPVRVENDARAAALGAYALQHAEGRARSMANLNLGTVVVDQAAAPRVSRARSLPLRVREQARLAGALIARLPGGAQRPDEHAKFGAIRAESSALRAILRASTA